MHENIPTVKPRNKKRRRRRRRRPLFIIVLVVVASSFFPSLFCHRRRRRRLYYYRTSLLPVCCFCCRPGCFYRPCLVTLIIIIGKNKYDRTDEEPPVQVIAFFRIVTGTMIFFSGSWLIVSKKKREKELFSRPTIHDRLRIRHIFLCTGGHSRMFDCINNRGDLGIMEIINTHGKVDIGCTTISSIMCP